ncbi:hypothetical protein DFQ27_005354 [Actinomortierella ambigua]|uniref:Uncharacterized protein n=1 Tax=Actinomortierella ambigua TaxID=1343610 RepID=A0A9P6UC51_9FUNG|nr:hypothetical protein DFQ26_000171 [Actinomortierella ambigua]KAG0268914.1 hypothetical protein DFQ27_005354 [Actinomortierella ambigua]
MNVLSPVASPSHSIASAFDPLSTTSFSESSSSVEPRTPPPAASSGAASPSGLSPPSGGAALGRKNTLKAYLANKHKLKERQSIQIVTNNSNSQTTNTTTSDAPGSPDAATSPRTASRMEQSLEDLDRQKNKIEESLAALTKEMLQYQPGHHYTTATGTTIISSPTDGVSQSLFDSEGNNASKVPADATLPGMRPLAELQQSKAALVSQLDQIIKERRTLLQSWSRDYKNLKRSGSLKQPAPENYWFSPN